jgi:hypothetical protein
MDIYIAMLGRFYNNKLKNGTIDIDFGARTPQ